MPILLSDLVTRTKQVKVEFAGTDDVLLLDYLPNALTPLVEAEFRASLKAEEATEGAINILSKMIRRWDLLADDKTMIPTDPATLRTLGSIFLGRVMERMLEDARPNPTTPAP